MGEILGTHGLRGTLRVALLTDFPGQLRRRRRLYLGDDHRPVDVLSVRSHGRQWLVQLAEVTSPEQAATHFGKTLWIRREEATRLPRGQHYWHEVVGLAVESTDGRALGKVEEIIRTGASDIYVVRGELGEVLVPAVKAFVKRIDPRAGRMLVQLVPGMLPGED